jgi:hypothetical protein
MASQHRPFVPENVKMKELTLRAVLLGLIMTVVLGAANAYLGLHAGMTIAATYPAAVIGMAVLRGFKGTILEENIARTAGSIGESVAAGAIFTLPAFVMAGSWTSFDPAHAYWKSTALMMIGSVLGVLFVSLVRRAQFLRQRSRLGIARPSVHVFPRTPVAELHSRRLISRRRLGRASRRRLAIHRATHRRRRHDGRRSLHSFQDAQEPHLEPRPRPQ